MAPDDGTDRNAWRSLVTPEMAVGISAVLLSLCGLFIAIYQASLERTQARAAVWPHVEVTASLNPGSVRLWVENTGMGPARIRTAAVSYDGEVLESWGGLAERMGLRLADVAHYRSMVGGLVLPAQSERELIFSITPEEGAGGEAAADTLARAVSAGLVDVELCYCSIYDECWRSTLQEMIRRWRGEAVADAPRPPDTCGEEPRSAI